MKNKEFNYAVDFIAKRILRNTSLLNREGGKFQVRQEKLLQKKLRSAWKRQEAYVLKKMQSLKFFTNRQNAMQDNVAPFHEIDLMLKELPEKRTIAAAIVGTMGSVMQKSAKLIIKKLKLGEYGISFGLGSPDAKKFLQERLVLELSEKKGAIDLFTKTKIKNILMTGAEKGLSVGQVGDMIRAQTDHGIFSVARAELIAQTELGRAFAKGQEIPMLDFQQANPDRVVEKSWVTVGDDRVRPEHTQNQNEGWVHINQVHGGTGEMSAPSSDFNCRCAEEYRVL